MKVNKRKISNYSKRCLKEYLKVLWYAPADAFNRTADTIVWRQCKLINPVLDIGCGDASISKLLFRGKKNIGYGLDNSVNNIKKAKNNKFYKKVVLAGVEKMPFKSKMFNTVISNSTFEHVRNDAVGIKEVSRVLRKNGRFMFTVPTKRLEMAVSDYVKSKSKLEIYNKRIEHYNYRSLSDWRSILLKNGLKVSSYKYYFDKNAVISFYKLYKIATFKIRNRELWSYLRDSPLEKVVPKKAISYIMYRYLEKHMDTIINKKGCWLFIEAKKVKKIRTN